MKQGKSINIKNILMDGDKIHFIDYSIVETLGNEVSSHQFIHNEKDFKKVVKQNNIKNIYYDIESYTIKDGKRVLALTQYRKEDSNKGYSSVISLWPSKKK